METGNEPNLVQGKLVCHLLQFFDEQEIALCRAWRQRSAAKEAIDDGTHFTEGERVGARGAQAVGCPGPPEHLPGNMLAAAERLQHP